MGRPVPNREAAQRQAKRLSRLTPGPHSPPVRRLSRPCCRSRKPSLGGSVLDLLWREVNPDGAAPFQAQVPGTSWADQRPLAPAPKHKQRLLPPPGIFVVVFTLLEASQRKGNLDPPGSQPQHSDISPRSQELLSARNAVGNRPFLRKPGHRPLDSRPPLPLS